MIIAPARPHVSFGQSRPLTPSATMVFTRSAPLPPPRPFLSVVTAPPTQHLPLPPSAAPSPRTPACFFSPLLLSPAESEFSQSSALSPVTPISSEWAETPSGESIPQLRRALQAVKAQMAALAAEQERLASALERAVRKQSPIHRLPRELLANIFKIGVLHMEDDDALMLPTLMGVCSHWREVALNTPALWSRVTISRHHSLQTARCNIKRSKGVALDVCIDFADRRSDGPDTLEHIVQAMEILRPATRRWRSFRLYVLNRPQAHAALARCRENAPLLEHLSIHIKESLLFDGNSDGPHPPLFNGHTPRLHYCSLASFNFGWDVYPVSRLRVLKLDGYWGAAAPSTSTILAILRTSPDLEELILRNLDDDEGEACGRFDPEARGVDDLVLMPPPSAQVIRLPRLRSISISYAGTVRARAIFAHLALPALESLEFICLDNVSPLLSFLRTQALTSLPLQRLRIESCYFNETKLAQLLERLQSLVTLELIEVEDATSSLMKALSTPQRGLPWACPRLEVLSLAGCVSFDRNSLRGVVESRLPSCHRSYDSPESGTPLSASATPDATSRPPVPLTPTQVPTSLRVHSPPKGGCVSRVDWPQPLHMVDVSRCPQVSREMVQWLKRCGCAVQHDTMSPS